MPLDDDLALGRQPRYRFKTWLRWASIFPAVMFIYAYRMAVRPLLIGSCKFCPSCSEYGLEALHTHGLLRGTWLTIRRVLRCHPFSPGGIDPVPPPRDRHAP